MHANANCQPPHSIEAEKALLSCCLLDGAETIKRCLDSRLSAEVFYSPANRVIFECVLAIHSRGLAVDVAIVAEELRSARKLEPVGGFAYLTEVSGQAPTTAQAAYFIEKVAGLFARRELLRHLDSARERAADLTVSESDLLGALQDGLASAGASIVRTTPPAFTVWRLSDFEKHVAASDDAILGDPDGSIYWRDRELALLVGPGGVGKSRLALGLAFSQILGREYLGFRLIGPPRTWLLAGNENSIGRQKAQLAAMAGALPRKDRDLIESHLLVQALVGAEADSMSLDDPGALALWRSTAAKWRPDVVVVDPWEAVVIGGDCNDSPATRESVRVLRSIFGPHNERFSPLIVHHAREGAQAVLGAEGFDAAAFIKGTKTLRSMARFQVNVAPEDPDDGGRIVLACGKINDARRFTPRGAVLEESTHLYLANPDFDIDAWRADVEGKRGGKACSVRDVVEAVRAGKHRSGDIVREVENATGACTRTIKSRIRDAVLGGYLAECPPRGNYTLGRKQL